MSDVLNEREAWIASIKNDPRPTHDLIGAALSSTDEDARWDLVTILHWRGTREVFEAARGLCRSDCPSERELGADVLGQLGVSPTTPAAFPEESVAVLLEGLAKETDLGALRAFLIALGHRKPLEAVPAIVRLKAHPDADIRYCVAYALGGHEDPLTINTLIELSGDEDAHVRDWATFGLGRLTNVDTPAIREALLRRVTDPDDDARGEALVGLARRNDVRVVEPLLNELSRDEVTEFALEAAFEIGDRRLYLALARLRARPECKSYPCLEDALERCQGEG